MGVYALSQKEEVMRITGERNRPRNSDEKECGARPRMQVRIAA